MVGQTRLAIPHEFQIETFNCFQLNFRDKSFSPEANQAKPMETFDCLRSTIAVNYPMVNL